MARQGHVSSGPFGSYTGYYNSPYVNMSQENSLCAVGVLFPGHEPEIEQQVTMSLFSQLLLLR